MYNYKNTKQYVQLQKQTKQYVQLQKTLNSMYI